jgi:hypothetical protein
MRRADPTMRRDPAQEASGEEGGRATPYHAGMAKKSRKRKARKKSAANHGKRPNS